MAVFQGLGGRDRTGTRFVSSEGFHSHPFGCENKKGAPLEYQKERLLEPANQGYFTINGSPTL